MSNDAATQATPIAVMSESADLIIWFAADGDERIVRLPCLSEEHAGELAKLCHRAFGMRTKENSFTTGLLHRDLEILCGL